MRVGPKESSPSKPRNYPLSCSSGCSISSGTTATTGTVPVKFYVDDNDDDDDIMVRVLSNKKLQNICFIHYFYKTVALFMCRC